MAVHSTDLAYAAGAAGGAVAGVQADRPLRVVLISHSGDLFGAERALLRLVVGLAQRPDFQPLVTVPFEGKLSARCRAYGIEVVICPYRQWRGDDRRFWSAYKRQVRNLLAWRTLKRRLRHFAPDVIYSNTVTISIGAYLARRLGVAHVWHLHEFNGLDRGVRYDWGWLLARRVLRARRNCLVGNSEAVRAHYARALARDDIERVYNGFDFSPMPDDIGEEKYSERVVNRPVTELLQVGALLENKGHRDAILAVADLVQSGRRVHLTIVGSGNADYVSQLQELVAEHRLEESVSFLDYVGDTRWLYEQAAITLVCTRAEGFGRTAVESLAHGTPVVGTDAGGLPEILRPGRSGLLYPPGDWRALSNRIQTLIDDRELYAEIATTGATFVRQNFPARRYVREMSELLTRAALGRKPELQRVIRRSVVPVPFHSTMGRSL